MIDIQGSAVGMTFIICATAIVIGFGLMIHSCQSADADLRRVCVDRGGTVIGISPTAHNCIAAGQATTVKP